MICKIVLMINQLLKDQMLSNDWSDQVLKDQMVSNDWLDQILKDQIQMAIINYWKMVIDYYHLLKDGSNQFNTNAISTI